MQAVARRSMLALAVISLIALARLGAAQRQTQNPADSGSLRALVASVPLLGLSLVHASPRLAPRANSVHGRNTVWLGITAGHTSISDGPNDTLAVAAYTGPQDILA